jgi:hypothetical protein
MPTLVEIPLDSGVNDQADSKLLPDGTLKVVENCILRRDGQFEVRPSDTQLNASTYNAGSRTLKAYDLINVNEDLCALGNDFEGATGPSGPTGPEYGPRDVFTFVDEAAAWKGVGSPAGPDGPSPLPWVTSIRDVAGAPDPDGNVTQVASGAYDGVAALMYRATGESISRVHIVKTEGDRTLIYQQIAGMDAPRVVVTTNGIFWFIGISGNDLIGQSCFPPVSETIGTSIGTLDSASSSITGYAACPVIGGDGGLATVVFRSVISDSKITIFDDSGGVVAQWGEPSVEAAACAIYANAAIDRVVVAYKLSVNNQNYEIITYEMSTGTVIDGPTTLFSGRTFLDGAGLISLDMSTAPGATAIDIMGQTNSALPPIRIDYEQREIDTHDLVKSFDCRDAWLQSNLLRIDEHIAFAYCLPTGDASNMLGSIDEQLQLCVKDFELSERFSHPLSGQLTQDRGTGKYYWSSVFKNSDGNFSPLLTEFEAGSRAPARRQTASLGGLLYIAGGMPTVFDGRMLVEQGFTERPRVVDSITSSDGDGNLSKAGIYTYALTYEWTDAQRNITRSAPSELVEVTLGDNDDTVSIPCSTPHSARCNLLAKEAFGSCVRVVAWRNICTVTQTAATLLTSPVTPPLNTLNNLVFGVSVDGGQWETFLFGPTDTTATQIAATINDNTSGLTATVEGASVRISSDTVGPNSSLQFGGNLTVLTTLGIALGQKVVGTRRIAVGANLQRAASVVVTTATAYGGYVTITDTISDEDLRAQEVLYTESQTPIPHYSPPPHDYVWAAGDALLIGGLPRRTEWVRSKRLFPAEPIEFANPGNLNFGGRGNNDITSVAVLEQNNLLFSRTSLQVVQGEGPDHSGQGEFFSPVDVPIDGGSSDWRPLIRTAEGLFFKLSDNKLYLMARGGNAAEWISFAVQDVIDQNPVIVGAAHVTAQQHVCFACNPEGGGNGVILRYDLRRKIWFTHTVSEGLRGIASYAGRLVYATTTGKVFLADNAPGEGSAVTMRIRTGSSVDFASLGYGAITRVGLMGEVLGPATISALISYDDATSFSPLGSFTFDDVQESFSRLWAPARQRTDRFVLEFTVEGSGSALLRLNKLLVELEKAPGPARLAAAANK